MVSHSSLRSTCCSGCASTLTASARESASSWLASCEVRRVAGLEGLVGIMMKRFGWPRPALLIGYVLAPQAETYFYQALQFNGWSFLGRPGVIIIGLMTLPPCTS